jgi:protein-S-isoprenylcysteine O-methyltransferase Ste14
MTFAEFRSTKLYDLLMGVPLILWFGNGAVQLRPTLVAEAAAILGGAASLFLWVQFLALLAAALFNLLLVWLVVVRDKPVLKSRGLLPRLTGFVGTFLGVGILHLPVAPLSLGWQIVAALLVLTGSTAAALILWRLGKAFSIMPEARSLVTVGPYAYARHPLYVAELVTLLGTAIQFQQPWAGLLAAAVAALQVARSLFEEQVLMQAYPEYAAYRVRTKRFIPGVI